MYTTDNNNQQYSFVDSFLIIKKNNKTMMSIDVVVQIYVRTATPPHWPASLHLPSSSSSFSYSFLRTNASPG